MNKAKKELRVWFISVLFPLTCFYHSDICLTFYYREIQCIVKRTALDEVLKAVQIIPYGFLEASEDANTIGEHYIWELLKVFWPEEEIDA